MFKWSSFPLKTVEKHRLYLSTDSAPGSTPTKPYRGLCNHLDPSGTCPKQGKHCFIWAVISVSENKRRPTKQSLSAARVFLLYEHRHRGALLTTVSPYLLDYIFKGLCYQCEGEGSGISQSWGPIVIVNQRPRDKTLSPSFPVIIHTSLLVCVIKQKEFWFQ